MFPNCFQVQSFDLVLAERQRPNSLHIEESYWLDFPPHLEVVFALQEQHSKRH